MDMSKAVAGPVEVFVDDVPVGHTQGPVTVEITPRFREVPDERAGATPVDYVLEGETVRVRLRLAEWTLANLQRVYPSGLGGSSELTFGRAPGFKLSSEAKQLRLHPVCMGSVEDKDVVLWRAAAASVVRVEFGNEGDSVFEVEFVGLPDMTKPDGERLGKIGA